MYYEQKELTNKFMLLSIELTILNSNLTNDITKFKHLIQDKDILIEDQNKLIEYQDKIFKELKK